MKLFDILSKCKTSFKIINEKNLDIRNVTINSKNVRNNYLFCALKGQNFNGQDFIKSILSNKDIAILTTNSKNGFENMSSETKKGIPVIVSQNIKRLLGEICSQLYPNIINELQSVTGTNGKTSVAHYIREIWTINNNLAASIGTLGTIFNGEISTKSSLTTPDNVSFHKTLKKLSSKGCSKLIIEASSIGIHQDRIYPVKFDKIAYTNLSRDHLDFHKTMKKYISAKAKLFKKYSKKSTIAVLNSDDKYYDYFEEICINKKINILDYGYKARFFKIHNIEKLKNNHSLLTIILKNKKHTLEIKSDIKFEIYNIICALLMVYGKKICIDNFEVIQKLSSPPGRIEKVVDNKFKVFIDYAHTPDALQKILKNISNQKKKKLFSIIGCGGDRDKGKRKLMTIEAIKYSDVVILADDNPRNENPDLIRKDMIKGLTRKQLDKIINIGDRKKAIKYGLNTIKKGDILVITGKGHEKYQIINNKKFFFSDHLEVKKNMKIL